MTPSRTYIELAQGTYQDSATLVVAGQRWFIGESTPIITSSSQGPILSIDIGSDVTIENVQISGATGTGTPAGDGILCPGTPTGSRSLSLVGVVLTDNASDGVDSDGCAVTAVRSTFSSNHNGVAITDGTASFDQCVIANNQFGGMTLSGGLFSVINSFIYRNAANGISIQSTQAANRIEFNTIVDNFGVAPGSGIDCSGDAHSFANNILARNTLNGQNGCTFPNSILLDGDVTTLHFKSPDTQPYDYHLTDGSVAIDQASASTLDHDFDGDMRPLGNGRDIGADEAQ